MNGYTVLWTNDRCRYLKRCGEEGKPLKVLFGGIHLSAPSFMKAKVSAGDFIYPVRVYKRTLYLISRLKVARYWNLGDFITEYCKIPKEEIADLHEYQIKQLARERMPLAGQLMPYGCGIEVVIAEESAPISFNRAVPPEILENLTFCSRGKQKKLLHIKDGLLNSSISLEGHTRRLCPESVEAFNSLIVTKR